MSEPVSERSERTIEAARSALSPPPTQIVHKRDVAHPSERTIEAARSALRAPHGHDVPYKWKGTP